MCSGYRQRSGVRHHWSAPAPGDLVQAGAQEGGHQGTEARADQHHPPPGGALQVSHAEASETQKKGSCSRCEAENGVGRKAVDQIKVSVACE